MNIKWSSKFQLKPGKWVFVPTAESVEEGRVIKKAIEQCWKPPVYYFHLRAGGHVEALRTHLAHSFFLRIDIQDFFGSINRTRVTRCLKPRLGYATARGYAHASTVPDPSVGKRTMVPFGFVQSQIIAAVCLADSALGVYLERLVLNSIVSVTVYVDDIVVSTSDEALLNQISQDLKQAAEKAGFQINAEKTEGPATAITVFNILLASGSMSVETERLQEFAEALKNATSDKQREGIKSYVTSVNPEQVLEISSSEKAV